MNKLKILLSMALILIGQGSLLSMNDSLVAGIRSSNVNSVSSLLKAGVDVNTTDPFGASFLIIALKIDEPNLEIIKLLLDAGANVDIPDKTALSIALKSDEPNIEIIRLLLAAGANVNAYNEFGIIPLTQALSLSNVNLELIRLLLRARADVNTPDKFIYSNRRRNTPVGCGMTPLMSALANEDISETVIKLLLDTGANVNFVHRSKGTPLMQALSSQNIEIIRLLLENGADVNFVHVLRGTPLMQALSRQNIEISKLLLENGADVNYAHASGGTPLALVLRRKNIELIRLFLPDRANARVLVKSKKTRFEQTLLMQVLEAQTLSASFEEPEASNYNFLIRLDTQVPVDVEIIDLLIRAGVNVNYFDQFNKITALIIALDRPNPNIEIIKLLIIAGADVNKAGRNHKTPLSFALDNIERNSCDNNLEIVRLLVEVGINFNLLDINRNRPLKRALSIRKISPELISILVDGGADVNNIDVIGDSVLMKAVSCVNINPKIIKILVDAGADVNKTNRIGESALIKASKVPVVNTDIIKILIDGGASVRKIDTNGNSSLIYVLNSLFASPEGVRILVDAGASLYGSLFAAVSSGGINSEIIQILIDKGADIEETDRNRDSVLIKALNVSNIDSDIIDLLINAGASVNATDQSWNSATKIAQDIGFIETDETLISVFFDNCLGIQGAFSRLLESKIAADINLGSSLKAHRTILAARIPNFNEDLLNQAFEGKIVKAILAFLRWIYTGTTQKGVGIRSFCQDLSLDFEHVHSESALKRDVNGLYNSREDTGDSIIVIPGHRDIYDVEVDEIRIPVHIDILNARSGLFRDMFQSGITRDQSEKVISREDFGIENVAIELICNAVIEFIYTEEISCLSYMTPYLLDKLKGMDQYFQLNGELDLYLERFVGESVHCLNRRRVRREGIKQRRDEIQAQKRELGRQDREQLRKLQREEIERLHKLYRQGRLLAPKPLEAQRGSLEMMCQDDEDRLKREEEDSQRQEELQTREKLPKLLEEQGQE